MAKKSLIAKAKAAPKFKVRAYAGHVRDRIDQFVADVRRMRRQEADAPQAVHLVHRLQQVCQVRALAR